MTMTVDGREPRAPLLTPVEIRVARQLQGDIPLVESPYRQIAEAAGVTENEVLSLANRLRKLGIIRKFAAIIRHQQAGYTHNVMVLWAVPPSRSNEVGEKLASFPEITHCYERVPLFAGKYNLFSMVHFQNKDEERLKEMAAIVGVNDFKVLKSLEEFKKISMEYF